MRRRRGSHAKITNSEDILGDIVVQDSSQKWNCRAVASETEPYKLPADDDFLKGPDILVGFDKLCLGRICPMA